MAFKYPISSQWITFPTDLKAHALIEWKENRLNHRDALYYHVKCFWGDLKIHNPKDGSDATKYHADRLAGRLGTVFTGDEGNINIVGTTKLYVAQEYVEKHYANGPLDRFHIKDLAKQKVKAPTASRPTIEKDEVAPWITMQLNENFHYGVEESGGRLRRWIVYHPPASEEISPPGMYQHRFTGLPKSEFLNAVASDMESAVPKEYKFAAKLGSKAIAMTTKALAAKFGDPLHRFLSNKAVQTARQSMGKLTVLSVMGKSEVSGREKELVAIQVFELDKIMLQLEECKNTLQKQKPDKEYELELRKWIKNNQQDLKTIYAAMDAEMGHGRADFLAVNPGQPENSSVPDPSSIVPEAVDSRQKAQLLTTQLVINMEIAISGDIEAPKATAAIKARQEEMKSSNPKHSHVAPQEHTATEYVFEGLKRDGPTQDQGDSKRIRKQESAYCRPSQRNIITNNISPKQSNGKYQASKRDEAKKLAAIDSAKQAEAQRIKDTSHELELMRTKYKKLQESFDKFKEAFTVSQNKNKELETSNIQLQIDLEESQNEVNGLQRLVDKYILDWDNNLPLYFDGAGFMLVDCLHRLALDFAADNGTRCHGWPADPRNGAQNAILKKVNKEDPKSPWTISCNGRYLEFTHQGDHARLSPRNTANKNQEWYIGTFDPGRYTSVQIIDQFGELVFLILKLEQDMEC
ncbi:hypothetical protein FGLOB1_13609 [Fusarium globosum]|uniref:Uncharacterized protein n=1 Tax=Fusarium globosum TaxID=78864 RepID=A0A8H5XMP6_9HYPO|nr:hypothetical protein FGLOB1_13609 [Fusarium globosum]